MPLPLHHLAIVVADLARAEAFYVELLGLPVERRWTDEAGAHRSTWVSLSGREGGFLAIERAIERATAPRRSDEAPGLHCLALGIGPDEREAWRARLTDAGHPVERESAYTLYVRDPDGNLVGLSHFPHPRAT
ncbi:MAG: VOC family protein [Deltaproteobacteria bacterium]|nr:VOC family protein [Deltaproteobacteria bacterium]